VSVQSDAAKRHIEGLLRAEYGMIEIHHPTQQKTLDGELPQQDVKAFMEYLFISKCSYGRYKTIYCEGKLRCEQYVECDHHK